MGNQGPWITTSRPVEAAAEALVKGLKAAGHRPRLAVAGGSAAQALGLLRLALGSAWQDVRLTWVDERCVPLADPASNRGSAYAMGYLDHGQPCGEALPLYLDGETPDGACQRVKTILHQRWENRLDVLLLGLGEDGHIASLFPGSDWHQGDVFPVYDSPKPPSVRLTLGLPLLCTAPLAVLLAMGEGKRSALAELKQGKGPSPARHLSTLHVVTDVVLPGL